ncbi:hypothetical protein G7054_g14963 [Neopestalotiopsis clavispora]|nr:hypothetical protein G7054_g14963 [Neopestalotiopsis clavispora]
MLTSSLGHQSLLLLLPHLEQAAADGPPDALDHVAAGQELGEDDDDLVLALDDHGQVVADLEAQERLVDEHVADLLRGYEARGGPPQDRVSAARRLDAQAAQHQQRLGRVQAADRDI